MIELTDLQIRAVAGRLAQSSYSATPDFDKDGIQIIYRVVAGYLYIVFRGSDEKADWWTNICFWAKKYKGNSFHGGYIKSLAPHVEEIIHIAESRNPDGLPIIITGHSAGGAWALGLAVVSELTPDQIVTFGSPRAIKRATESTQAFLNRRLTNYKNAYDFVTKLPLLWRDFGKQVVTWFRVEGGIEHQMELYNERFFAGVLDDLELDI